MPGDLIAFRCPPALAVALRAEAGYRGLSLTKVIIEKLEMPALIVNGTSMHSPVPGTRVVEDVGGEADGQGAPAGPASKVADEPLSPSATVTPLHPEQVAERDRRHLSPTAMPDRERVREGFSVAESECDHPRGERKVLSYMTSCKLCGKRVQ